MNENASDQRLNTLVVATTFPRWEKDTEPSFVLDLSEQLAKTASLTVLAPHAPGAKFQDNLRGVPIIRYPYSYPTAQQAVCYDGGILPNLKSRPGAKGQLPGFLLSQLWHLWRVIRKRRINFVHCHWVIPQGIFVALVCRALKIPYILTAHGGDAFAFKNSAFVGRLKGFALSGALHCAVNSQAVRRALEPHSPKTSFPQIPNGIDSALFNGNKKDPSLKERFQCKGTLILGVGRFVEKKGFAYLIDAMPGILQSDPDARLLLVGYGPEEAALKKRVTDNKLNDVVQFPGPRSGEDLAALYATADIFIGPSIVADSGDTEGQGIVFLEALASETAVIASNVGGIADVIRDRETGLLVPQKNAEAIASAAAALIQNPDLVEQFRSNGRNLIESRYSWEQAGADYLKLYQEAATSQGLSL